MTNEQSWIKVEDKLPDISLLGEYRYLVVEKGQCQTRIEIAAYEDGREQQKIWFSKSFEILENVTHWMPLPKLPGAQK